jgi:hypothetical protein
VFKGGKDGELGVQLISLLLAHLDVVYLFTAEDLDVWSVYARWTVRSDQGSDIHSRHSSVALCE